METSFFNSWFFYGLLSSVPFLYWFLTKNFSYWADQGISGPKPYPVVGNLVQQLIRPLPLVELEWFNKFGKIYGVFNGSRPSLVLGDPELIKDVMVKDFPNFTDRMKQRRIHPILRQHLVNAEGEDWKRIRGIVSPTFSSGKMKKMYPLIKHCLNDFLAALDKHAVDGRDLDMKVAFGNYTMDVIATCAFATKTNTHNDPNDLFMTNATAVFNPKLYRMIPQVLLPRPVLKFFKMYSSIDESVNEFFFELTRHMIRERKNSNKKYNDLLDLMLNVQQHSADDKEDVKESHHVNLGKEELESERKAFASVKDKYLTEEEILAQAWVFFNAGYETTASTLTFAAYELALNPEVQEKLFEEVVNAVDGKGDLDYDVLSTLPYLDAVISETLRLHSPVVRTVRQANNDYKLGNTGITIKKNQVVEIPIYAIQQSELFWQCPAQFDPERFMPENRHKIIPYTYLPFGGGPRNCIGMRFALMEAKVGLAQVVRRFRLVRCANTDVPLKMKRNMVLQSVRRVVMAIEKR